MWLDLDWIWNLEVGTCKLDSKSSSKINFYTLFRARRAVLTPETEPVKPGFLRAHKPGFTGLKMGGLPGFSGTRVSFPGVHTSEQDV